MTDWSLGAGLAGKGVVVTGAARGIGRATAEAFAAVGARVCAVDQRAAAVEQLVDSLGPDRHLALPFDITQTHRHDEILDAVSERFGGLYVLAHVAAVLRRQPLAEVTEADWDAQVDVNLKASFFLNRAAADRMKEIGAGGRIINFTSGAWLTGPQHGSHVYVASKGGVVSMTRGFARAYGPDGILVNTVAPGQIDTPMQREDNTEATMAAAVAACPLRRMGQPSELAGVVVFLASDHGSFISGATINVSGGAIMY